MQQWMGALQHEQASSHCPPCASALPWLSGFCSFVHCTSLKWDSGQGLAQLSEMGSPCQPRPRRLLDSLSMEQQQLCGLESCQASCRTSGEGGQVLSSTPRSQENTRSLCMKSPCQANDGLEVGSGSPGPWAPGAPGMKDFAIPLQRAPSLMSG